MQRNRVTVQYTIDYYVINPAHQIMIYIYSLNELLLLDLKVQEW